LHRSISARHRSASSRVSRDNHPTGEHKHAMAIAAAALRFLPFQLRRYASSSSPRLSPLHRPSPTAAHGQPKAAAAVDSRRDEAAGHHVVHYGGAAADATTTVPWEAAAAELRAARRGGAHHHPPPSDPKPPEEGIGGGGGKHNKSGAGASS
jgi:hypothetical protein